MIGSILSGHSSFAKAGPGEVSIIQPNWKSSRVSVAPGLPPYTSRSSQAEPGESECFPREGAANDMLVSHSRRGWADSHTKELYRSIVWDQPGMAAIIAGTSTQGSVHRGAVSSMGMSSGRMPGSAAGQPPERRGSADVSRRSSHIIGSDREALAREPSTVCSRISIAAGSEKPRQSAQVLWQKARLAEQVRQRVRGPKVFMGAAMEGSPHGIHRAIVPKFVPPSVSVAAAHSQRAVRPLDRLPDFIGAAALAVPRADVSAQGTQRPDRPVVQEVRPRRAAIDARLQNVQREVSDYKKLLEQAEFGRNAVDVVVHQRSPHSPAGGDSDRGDVGGRGDDSRRHGSDVPELAGKSFNLFPAGMWLRRRVYGIVSHQQFDNFILLCIFLSCCAMVYEHPQLEPGALDTRILSWLDIVLTAIFGAECLLKMFAYCVRRYLQEHSNKVCNCCCRLWLVVAEAAWVRQQMCRHQVTTLLQRDCHWSVQCLRCDFRRRLCVCVCG